MNCRFCKNPLTHEFADLVNSPPSNSYLRAEQLNEPEVFYPLKVFVCEKCFLVQIDESKKADEIFDENYAYFSSFSKSWLAHSKKYVEMMSERFGFDQNSQGYRNCRQRRLSFAVFCRKRRSCSRHRTDAPARRRRRVRKESSRGRSFSALN